MELRSVHSSQVVAPTSSVAPKKEATGLKIEEKLPERKGDDLSVDFKPQAKVESVPEPETLIKPQAVYRPAEIPKVMQSEPSTVGEAILGLSASTDAQTSQVIQKTYEILGKNRVAVTEPGGKYQVFTTPSLSDGAEDSRLDYGGKQWLWDSSAHAMNLAYTEPKIAKAELRAMFANQDMDPKSKDVGFVPHMNYFFGDGRKVPDWAKKHFQSFLDGPEGKMVPPARHNEFLNNYWSSDVHSDITQPPILGMAVQEVVKATGDKEFAKEMVPKLKAYYDYLHDRRADSDGLVRIIHPWESGWDNSQRWDEAVGVDTSKAADVPEGQAKVERSSIDVQKIRLVSKYKALDWDLDKILDEKDFQMKPVDFNVLYAKNMESLSKLCDEIGDEAGAEKYAQRSEKAAQSIFENMWDGDKYVDIVQTPEGDHKSEVKSAAMFYPMMLKGEPHSKHLIHNHLANPKEFNPDDGYMVPTTSLDDPTNDGGQYWRGNVWGIVNFFVHSGVKEHLKKNPGDFVAGALAKKSRDSMFELLDQADFYEYFNTQKVKEGDKPEGYGVQSFGWNGLAMFMDKTPAFLD
jgi:glycogen debranching enzyme